MMLHSVLVVVAIVAVHQTFLLQLDSSSSNVHRIPAAPQLRQPSNSVVSLGGFANMKYDEEHAYGYAVQLWRDQNRVFGLFLSSQGLMGDTPTGLLEDVRFNHQTGTLSFRARLTTGLFSNRQFHNVPSRDIFQFRGVLKSDQLVGTLEITNGLTPDEIPRRERIRLKRSKEQSELMFEAQSYDKWKSKADEILKFRGPKW